MTDYCAGPESINRYLPRIGGSREGPQEVCGKEEEEGIKEPPSHRTLGIEGHRE